LIEKINSKETNFCQWFKRESYSHIIKRITNFVSSSTMNNFLIANLLHFCLKHERLWEVWHWQCRFVTFLSLLFPPWNMKISLFRKQNVLIKSNCGVLTSSIRGIWVIEIRTNSSCRSIDIRTSKCISCSGILV
jgi:hypothetical protein